MSNEVTTALSKKFKKSLLPSPGRIFLSIQPISLMFEKRTMMILLDSCPSQRRPVYLLKYHFSLFLLLDSKFLKRCYQIVNNLQIFSIYQPIWPSFFVAGRCLCASLAYMRTTVQRMANASKLSVLFSLKEEKQYLQVQYVNIVFR
jgi:hypothetical protein